MGRHRERTPVALGDGFGCAVQLGSCNGAQNSSDPSSASITTASRMTNGRTPQQGSGIPIITPGERRQHRGDVRARPRSEPSVVKRTVIPACATASQRHGKGGHGDLPFGSSFLAAARGERTTASPCTWLRTVTGAGCHHKKQQRVTLFC